MGLDLDSLRLDFLKQGKEMARRRKFMSDADFAGTSEVTEIEDSFDLAILLHGKDLLGFLAAQDRREGRLYDAVDHLKLSLDELLPLVNRLEKQDFIRFAQQDRKGNHLITLTDKGVRLMGL